MLRLLLLASLAALPALAQQPQAPTQDLFPGYTATREFYSPDYLINPEPEVDDIRTTLYWNPYILGSGKERKFSFTFYNSDVTHHIRIILEGIDENGKLIHLEKTID